MKKIVTYIWKLLLVRIRTEWMKGICLMCSRPFGYDPIAAQSRCLPSSTREAMMIAQFPKDVYQNAGISTVLPHLMECLDIDKVPAVQFMRDGRVRLICQDPEACNDVLWTGLDFDGLSVRLTPAHNRLRTAYLRNLPAEVDYDVVSFLFSEYGEVF